MLYEKEAVGRTDKVWHPIVSTRIQGVSVKCLLDSSSVLNSISQTLLESNKGYRQNNDYACFWNKDYLW